MSSEGGLALWLWDDYSDEEKVAEWAKLVDWVEDLRQTYRTTVRLPACWPRHKELVNELKLFWVWDQLLRSADHPEEALRWHSWLRQAAEAWRRLANCDHEALTEIDKEIALKRRHDVNEHFDHALRESGLRR
jgi:hypothetical protein